MHNSTHLSKNIFFVFLFSYSYLSHGQVKIKGIVKDPSNVAIEFANVVLTNQKNEIVKGTITDKQGQFRLSVRKAVYKLSISFLGYKNWSRDISPNNNYDLGRIILNKNKNDLDEVVIKGKKKIIERKVDRLVFNVENSVISTGNSWDLLKHTPGVIVSPNGGMQIMGKGELKIMINNKIVQLSQEDVKNMLESISADDIASIEIITIPPAKYDAEGSGLLNIKLKQNKVLGIKGNFNSSYKQGILPKFDNGVSLFFKGKKMDLAANYSLRNGINVNKDDGNIQFLSKNDNTPTSLWDEFANTKSNYVIHNYRFSVDYELLKRLRLGFKSTGNIKPKSDSKTNSNTFVYNNAGALDSIFTNNNTSDGNTKNLSYNIFLDKKFKKEGHTLSLDATFLDYENNRDQVVNTNFFSNNKQFTRNEAFGLGNDQKIRVQTYNIDYSLPIDSISTINAGIKYNKSTSDNDLKYRDVVNNISTIDSNRSDIYKYNEDIFAWYISFTSSIGKFYYKLGLRHEFTNTKGSNSSLSQNNTSNNFNSLFPSLYLQYKINKKNSIGFSYGKRIKRPKYWHLNPFKRFNSPFSFFEGNPFLRPSISNDLEISYTLNNKYFLTAFFKKEKEPFTQLSIQNNKEHFLKYIVVNLDNNISYGLSLNTSYKFTSWWTAYISSNIYYKESNFINPTNNEFTKNKNWNFDPFFGNEITISSGAGMSLENTNQFISSKVQGGFNIKPRFNCAIGVKKDLFKKNGLFAIYIEDIFNSNFFKLNSNYSNQNHSSEVKNENRFIRFSFQYRFGSNKIKQQNRQDKSQEEKNRL